MTTSEDYLHLADACERDAGFSSWIITADWLDEHGEPALAEAYRWCARDGKRPYFSKVYQEFWWLSYDAIDDDFDNSTRLNSLLLSNFKESKNIVFADDGLKICKSFTDAMHALAVALERWEEFKLNNRRAVRKHAEMRMANLATV